MPETTPPEPMSHEIGNRTYLIADVEPLDVDGVRTVAVGSGLWLLAFVLLLPFCGRLRADDRLWMLWTCLAGFGLGIIGWDYCRRRRNARLARVAAAGPATPDATPVTSDAKPAATDTRPVSTSRPPAPPRP